MEPLESKIIYLYYDNSSANSFYVPPLGNFQKEDDNPKSAGNVLPENIVYDNETNLYWMTYGMGCGLASSEDMVIWEFWGTPEGVPAGGHSCFLLKYDDLWYFYKGRNLATSSSVNGTYTSHPNNPMYELGAEGEWDDDNNGEEVSVFYYNGTWYMFYMGDSGSAVEQVGYLTADNPAGPWVKYSENPVLAFGSTGVYDAGTIADPITYTLNNLTYIFYAASSTGSSPWQEASAFTKDFVNFFKRNLVLGRGTDDTFDDENTHRGGIILHNDYYYFSYAARNVTNTSSVHYFFGLAKQYAKNIFNGYPPEQVYELYENFNKSYLQSQWRFKGSSSGFYTLSDGKINLTSGDSLSNKMLAVQEFNSGTLLESKFRIYNLSSNYFGIGFGKQTTNLSKLNEGGGFASGNLSNALNASSKIYVNVPFSQSLNLSSQITLEAFVYPYDNTTTYQGIISRREDSGSTAFANYALWLNGDEITFGFTNSTNAWKNSVTSNLNINTSQWYHVAAQFDTDINRVTIFLNGKLVLNVSQTSEPLVSNNTPVKIGYSGYSTQYFNGLIDEVRISNVTRYSEDFSIMTSEFSSDSNTVGLYHFDQNESHIVDSSFSANHGSILIRGASFSKFSGIVSSFGNFMFSNANDLTYNFVNSNITLDEEEHTIKIKWVNNSLISYKLDDGNWVNNTQNIYETETLNPMFIVGSGEGNTTLEIDYIKVVQDKSEIKPLVYYVSSSSAPSTSSTETQAETQTNSGISGTYRPSQNNLANGYTIKIKKTQKVEIPLGENKKQIVVESVNDEEIVVSANGENYNVNSDNSTKIDLNNDGYYDVEVSVVGKTINGYANLEFTLIHEEIPKTNEEEQNENIFEEIPKAIKEMGSWKVYVLIGVIIVLVVVWILLDKKIKHKRRYMLYGY